MFRVTGFYSFLGDDGKKYNVSYAADEHGYRKTQETIKMIPMPELNRNQNNKNNRDKIVISSIDPNLSKTLLSG